MSYTMTQKKTAKQLRKITGWTHNHTLQRLDDKMRQAGVGARDAAALLIEEWNELGDRT